MTACLQAASGTRARWRDRNARCSQAPSIAIIGGGYTGLSTAYHLRRADPSLKVAVLEAERIGYGASGRNAGFVMTLFGASVPMMKMLHGAARVREAHEFMVRAIDGSEATVRDSGIDCDYRRHGFLKVATSPDYVSRIREEVELMQSLGIGGIEWLEKPQIEARVAGAGYLGAWWEPGSGSLNPVKWLFGLAAVAQASGAEIYEGARVVKVRRSRSGYELTTAGGGVTARKIVYATNGYSHLVPGLAFRQFPAFTYVIVTEPLTDAQLASLRWPGREGVEDGLNFMHYYRLTVDNRLIVGGGPGVVPFGNGMNHEVYPKAWNHLEAFIARTFPQLGPVKVAYRWGGAFSMTSDFTPKIGTLRSGSAFYSIGCTGHGVAMTHANGQILRDLVLERKTDLTSLWFVDRWSMLTPPEPVRYVVTQAAARLMSLDDKWCSRKR
jgi:glycine/D-amino acid oxidase-like deaminating enzyme